MLKGNLGKNWAATCRPIAHYFVQDIVAPDEGPHADEVKRVEFANWAVANPESPITYDEGMNALFLHLDETTGRGITSRAPHDPVVAPMIRTHDGVLRNVRTYGKDASATHLIGYLYHSKEIGGPNGTLVHTGKVTAYSGDIATIEDGTRLCLRELDDGVDEKLRQRFPES